ncbi:helix-turn-helix transcriptional regulator [Gordonia sp. NPDC003429]
MTLIEQRSAPRGERVGNTWTGYSPARNNLVAGDIDVRTFPGGHVSASVRRTGTAWCVRLTGELDYAARAAEQLTRPFVPRLCLGTPIDGTLSGTQDGKRFVVRPGEVVALRNDHEFQLHAETHYTDVACICIATDHLSLRAINLDAATARTWPLSPVAIHARNFIADTILDESTNPLIQLPQIDEIFIRLALLLLPSIASISNENDGSFNEVRRSVLDIIDSRSADPTLSCTSIADALRTSTRTLYRAFEGTGVTVSGLITAKRLAGAATDLAHGSPHRTIAAVARAHGFGGADQLARSFKRNYGMRPADFRCFSGNVDDRSPHNLLTGMAEPERFAAKFTTSVDADQFALPSMGQPSGVTRIQPATNPVGTGRNRESIANN